MSYLVSVIITTHGRLQLLKKAVKSVIGQSYDNVELIVVDDCSEDGTREWAEEQDNFKYIYIRKEESKGGNYARNLGIKASSGKYIAFLDDDDSWESDKLEKQIRLFKTNPKVGFVYCGYNIIRNDGKRLACIPKEEYRGNLAKKSLYYIVCTTSALVVEKDRLLEVGMFDEELKFWQETELIIRLSQVCEADFVGECLMNYLQDTSKGDSHKLSTKLNQWLSAIEYINNKHGKLIENLSAEEKRRRELLICGDAANRCLLSNQKEKRKYYKKRILELQPSIPNLIGYILGIDKQWLIVHGLI